MAHGVASEVRSIIESFINGLEVLSKLRKKHKRKTSKSQTNGGAAQLSRSLRQGPGDICREYDRGMRLGEHYAYGDGIARTSLAEILLRLNTGLVSIITSFLATQRGGTTVDYETLTRLSESSRKDSLDVLRQLYQRMASRFVPAQIPHDRIPTRTRTSGLRAPAKQTKNKGSRIARVTIEDSSKRSQLAVVKRRTSPVASTSNLGKPVELSRLSAGKGSSMPVHERSRSSSALSTELSAAKAQRPSRRSPVAASMSSPDILPPYSKHDHAMPPQHRQPLPAQYQPQKRPEIRQRKYPPTVYSLASDSTKLGEIPLHKWAVPYDFVAMSVLNKEAMQSGWPLTDLDGNAVLKPKKRAGLFRLFRRTERA